MAKLIQVSDAMYQSLMMYKGEMMAATKKAVTFDAVIAHEFTKANHLGIIISRLVQSYPEERERIVQIAEETESYEYIKAMVEITGKHPTE